MPRVKRGVPARERHRKILKLAAGQKNSRHKRYRMAHEAFLHSQAYAYRDRRDRKPLFRRLWIIRINAAARLVGLSYSRLVDGLGKAGVAVDRKMLADLAVRDPAAFAVVAETAKKSL